MKIYETIEFFCSEGCLEEITTNVFLNESDARLYFETRANLIDTTVHNECNSVGTEDGECECVLQRTDEMCDAWKSYSAMEWEWCIKLKTHDL